MHRCKLGIDTAIQQHFQQQQTENTAFDHTKHKHASAKIEWLASATTAIQPLSFR